MIVCLFLKSNIETIIKYLILVGLIVLAFFKESKAQFVLSAEIRPRTEVRNGFKTPTNEGFDAAVFTEQRSRLTIDYRQEKYQMKLAFQDVRFWGETTQIFKREIGTTFLSEAWGEVYFSGNVSLKAGRQIITYDNERILGALEWAQQGRRHDAVLLKYENAEQASKLHLGFSFNGDQDIPEPAFLQSKGANFYSVSGSYKTMQFAWYHKDFTGGKISALALNNGFQNADSTVSNKQTIGFLLAKKVGKIMLETENYYQTGSLNKKHVNAWLAGINATVNTKLTPLTIGYQFISGESNASGLTAFNPDFGTNHAHNGFMDYFFVGPSNGNVGVQDFYLKTRFKMGKGFLQGNAHHFLTGAEQFTNAGDVLNRSMGTEIDLVYSRKIADITFHLGFSELFATDTMLTLRGGNKSSNNWAWMMISFNPTLFSSKN
jgi:hypothetical protein